MSLQQNGAFMGFSIEMSVSTQVLGRNSSAINVPFLNLMASLVERAGWVQIRVGGNSQEQAELKLTLEGYSAGTILGKDNNNTSNPTGTPPLEYTNDLFVMLGKISDMVNVNWYLGVPFFNIDPVDMDIVVTGNNYLGDRVLAYQVGNEPDLYGFGGRDHRPDGYAPINYTQDFGTFISQVDSNSSISRRNGVWLVPSISATVWNIDDVVATGIISTYRSALHAMTVERYPNDNCGALYGTDAPVNPQDALSQYTSHASVVNTLSYYSNSSAYAVSQGIPYIMFETNTASCSGFPGISDAFAAALWGVDWSMTLAFNNFSAALFHIGGQSAFYNAFTPPPTNQSSFRQWTVGPIYYSALVMSEILGKSNASQVVDLFQNSNNEFTPGWAVYENGTPKKVVLINYVTDPTGTSDYTASISVGGGTTGQAAAVPSSVNVKYLLASSVTSKTNMTWAGQTLGDHFGSDGRLQGDVSVKTVQCDTTNNVCQVSVPAPGLALVFLDEADYEDATPTSTVTFPTTYYTNTINTVIIDASMLASSNGHTDMGSRLDSTSPGSRSNARSRRCIMPEVLVLGGLTIGLFMIL